MDRIETKADEGVSIDDHKVIGQGEPIILYIKSIS